MQKSLMKKSLMQNFSWNLIGNIVYAATQWGIIVVLAKFSGSETIGLYSLALAVTAPVFMLANLQLRQVHITDIKEPKPFGVYLGLRCVSAALACVFILIICFFNNYSIATTTIILLIAIAKAIESISDMLFGVFQKNEVMDLMSKSLIIKGSLSLVILLMSLLIFNNFVLSILVSFVFTRIFMLFFYDLKYVNKIVRVKIEFKKEKLYSLAIQSMPLGIVMMLISLNENIPRYFLEHFVGTKELGYFASIAYIPFSGNIIIMALGQAASPKLAHYYSENKIRNFVNILMKFLLVGLALLILGVIITKLFGQEILKMLYTNDFAQYHELLVILMIYFGLGYISSFFGFALTAMRNFKVQPYLLGVVVIANIIFSATLIPQYKVMGAAYAMIIASLVYVLISGWACYVTLRR
ncbi:oligosaccharide flippase family protein [Bacillus sp. NPDC094106]|uniref:oligosaccharide flippase family protein n=1 Tax=Bacillus sp. NPDC094106 TaxID=3363949 RepID=UPI0037FEA190